jgi:hypothetical protein
MEFDLGRAGADPIVYACVNADHLASLPVDELSVLGVGADMSNEAGDSVFFVGDDKDLVLYVDTDDYPDFRNDLGDIANAHGINLSVAEGQWASMLDNSADFVAPDVPGFVSRGYQKIDPDVALVLLEKRAIEKRLSDDDQRPESI